jgi:hypothetical protein
LHPSNSDDYGRVVSLKRIKIFYILMQANWRSFMVKHALKVIALIGLSLVASACVTRISSDVARFNMLGKPQGETVRIVPADAEKQGSLEFAAYAAQIGERLGALGYKPSQPGDKADIEARLDYKVSEGREKIQTRPAAFSSFRGFGGFCSRFDPFCFNGFGGFYPRDEVFTTTVFTRALNFTMTRTTDGQQVFEGRVESVGTDRRLPEVMPLLIQALFTDFPGQNGSTKRVVIEVPQK